MNTIPDDIKKDFSTALLAGEKARCSQLIRELSQQHQTKLESIYEHLLKPSLYTVGDLWEQNKITVATEHLASSIVDSILTELYMQITPSKTNGKRAVLSGVPGEMHQIGVKMVNDVLEKHGWETFFLGANLPTKDLVNFAKGVKPHLFALSMSLYFNLPAFMQLLTELRIHFPDTKIIIGGQGFTRGGTDITRRFNNIEYYSDLFQLEDNLKKQFLWTDKH